MITKADISVQLVDYMGSDLSVVNAARVSFDKFVDELGERDVKLLGYLADHDHWSPFAHTCITVRCKAPIWLARQLVKHQVGGSWNEVSRRYVDTPPEMYIPETVHSYPVNKKQGSGDMHENSEVGVQAIEQACKASLNMYQQLLSAGVAPEEARGVLPLNTMTEWVWTGSVMFFARVIRQRSDEHAQLGAQEFARKLREVIEPLYPESFKALLKG